MKKPQEERMDAGPAIHRSDLILLSVSGTLAQNFSYHTGYSFLSILPHCYFGQEMERFPEDFCFEQKN